MNISVSLTPGELKTYLSRYKEDNRLIVIIDILRATTTIITAILNGAKWVHPVLSPRDAFRLREEIKGGEEVLIAGERDGRIVSGFDLGNSPYEFCEEVVKGKGIIMSTTNGTVNISYASNHGEVIIASFINISSVITRCINSNTNILLACSGRYNLMCIEDVVCAGYIINNVMDKTIGYTYEMDSVISSRLLCNNYIGDILNMLKTTQHGRYLISLGYEKDIEYASRFDITDIVLTLYNDRVVLKDI
ncbi:MAG: 2-phosphosulfolactate phosphatase [bacterium]